MERTRELIKSLGEFGFDDSVNFNAAIFDVETLSMIRLVIRDNFTRTKIIRDLDLTQSYPLKHKIENYFREIEHPLCITNGLLIYAMYLEGYRVRRVKNSINAYFDVSTASVRKFMKKINA